MIRLGSFFTLSVGDSERALDAAERLGKARQRARHAPPEADLRRGVAAVRRARRDVTVDAGLRGDLRAVPDREMPGEADLAAEHHPPPEDRPAPEPGLGRDET